MKGIEPKYVTFEQAKWLKEKGFDLRVIGYSFLIDDKIHLDLGFLNHNKEVKDFVSKISRPEQWQVVEWLRINHGIWVEVFKQRGINGLGYNFMCVPTEPGENRSTPVINEEGYDSPQETYSAAFDYILKKLWEN